MHAHCTLPYHTVPCHTVTYTHIITCHTISCHAMLCHAMPCHTLPIPYTIHHTFPHTHTQYTRTIYIHIPYTIPFLLAHVHVGSMLRSPVFAHLPSGELLVFVDQFWFGATAAWIRVHRVARLDVALLPSCSEQSRFNMGGIL